MSMLKDLHHCYTGRKWRTAHHHQIVCWDTCYVQRLRSDELRINMTRRGLIDHQLIVRFGSNPVGCSCKTEVDQQLICPTVLSEPNLVRGVALVRIRLVARVRQKFMPDLHWSTPGRQKWNDRSC